jgi:hypothetical protein
LRGTGGIPQPTNPTFSFALPGPAPLGVPNFFIEKFQLPPFLLPIYQAAGIEYDVPWQVLASINEVETDYGRNLSISSKGAIGWMQFLPSTWKRYGVDANGDGIADPYNPEDAIFTAARYLHAAGASTNLGMAIFAYNHATWYVQSVLLRAKLIGGMPTQLIGALTGLVSGHFPVAGPAKYADDSVEALATRRVSSDNAAEPVNSDPNSQGVNVFAKPGTAVIAVNDGKIVGVGSSPALGKYIQLQDATGNVYTYSNLGSIPQMYAVPKPVHITASDINKQLAQTPAPAPTGPASAGTQSATGTLTLGRTTVTQTATTASAMLQHAVSATSSALNSIPTSNAPLVKQRLFAHPSRAASYAAGGAQQIESEGTVISNFDHYFSDTLHLAKNQYTMKPLAAGSIVVAGTVLGRVGQSPIGSTLAPHLYFQIQPAGKNAPQIDPKPILDGWKLLEATAVYRAKGVDPFYGPGAKNPTIGQVLLMSKDQLEAQVLGDPNVKIYACGQRDIEAGLVDRRILAVLEFLSGSGLDPTVSGLVCGHSFTGSTGVDAAGATGSSVDISQINGIPILGHQGSGSITDMAIRTLLNLQGSMSPNQIISLMSYKGQSATLALPDHANRLQITFTPLFGQNKAASSEIASVLKPAQWIDLIQQIGKIAEPSVPTTPSKYAIQTSH